MDELPVEHPITVAQKRLAQIAMRLPMNPQAAAISAFVNGLLVKAQVDALVILATKVEPEGLTDRTEAYQAYLIQALTAKADELARTLDAQPRLVLAGHG